LRKARHSAADELAEFVALYWADGRVPLSAQVKKGLAGAFTSFDEYALVHWERLLVEGRLSALALLRSLRNMKASGVSEDYIAAALDTMRTDRVLPLPLPVTGVGADSRTRDVSLAQSSWWQRYRDSARRTHCPVGRRLRKHA
jgi:hypothetical protein